MGRGGATGDGEPPVTGGLAPRTLDLRSSHVTGARRSSHERRGGSGVWGAEGTCGTGAEPRPGPQPGNSGCQLGSLLWARWCTLQLNQRAASQRPPSVITALVERSHRAFKDHDDTSDRPAPQLTVLADGRGTSYPDTEGTRLPPPAPAWPRRHPPGPDGTRLAPDGTRLPPTRVGRGYAAWRSENRAPTQKRLRDLRAAEGDEGNEGDGGDGGRSPSPREHRS